MSWGGGDRGVLGARECRGEAHLDGSSSGQVTYPVCDKSER